MDMEVLGICFSMNFSYYVFKIIEFTVMNDKQVKIRPVSHEDPMSFPTEDSLDNSV